MEIYGQINNLFEEVTFSIATYNNYYRHIYRVITIKLSCKIPDKNVTPPTTKYDYNNSYYVN